MSAQAPEGAAWMAEVQAESQGGCPTAGDTPLPVPHNGEILCHSPFSDLWQAQRWHLSIPLGDSLHAVTLCREAECGESLAGLPGMCTAWGQWSSEVKSHKTRYSVTDADNLIKALARLHLGDSAASFGACRVD